MTKPLTIPDHLGLKLAALFDEPATPGPHPLVIMLHGFTGWKEEPHLAALAADLAAVGIAALRFDAPGSGESEGTWAEHYRLTNYIADVTDVLAYAKANLPIDPHRIAIWGHSLGGFTALAAAVRAPQDFVAVCGCQPSNGWKLATPEVEHQWKISGWNTFSNSHFTGIKLPYAFFTDRQQYNALGVTPQLKIPALFIAGTTDELVKAKNVRAMYDVAPEPKTYLEFPASHDYKKYPDLLRQINAATVKFFQHHLGSGKILTFDTKNGKLTT
jgi:dienelactone hydrolase